MSSRIDVDPKAAVGGWLVLMDPRSGGDDGRLGLGDVGNRQVEVHLLRVTAAWPRRLDPVIDPLESQRRATIGVVR